jgi:hypothetical protein
MENSVEKPDPRRFCCPEPVGRRRAACKRSDIPQRQHRRRRLAGHPDPADWFLQRVTSQVWELVRRTANRTNGAKAGLSPAFLLLGTALTASISPELGLLWFGPDRGLEASARAAADVRSSLAAVRLPRIVCRPIAGRERDHGQSRYKKSEHAHGPASVPVADGRPGQIPPQGLDAEPRAG